MMAQFSLRLICGMSLIWCVMPRSQVTSGFFRIQMLVALGLSVLAAISFGQFPFSSGSLPVWPHLTGRAACASIAVLAFLGSVMWTLEHRPAGAAIGVLMCALSAVVLFGASRRAGRMDSWAVALSILSETATILILGSAVTGMLLGHWYLTSPTMSIEPLRRLTLYFGFASVFRLAVSGASLLMAWDRLVGTTTLTWLVLRWIAGIVGPIVVVFMVWRILRYRNTQSATGVLFAGVILTFIGELTASLLYHEVQIPL